MNSDLAEAAVCYGVYDGDEIIAFMAVLHQPHGVNKRIKRVSRLVVLPDYQGIGIGTKFLNAIAQRYAELQYDFSIVTSAKNLIHALRRSDKWILQHYGRNTCTSNKSVIDYKRTTKRNDCKTASFYYRM